MILNRKLNRLKACDYAQNGCYFVTMCVKNREDIFGHIKNEGMTLNEYGEIVTERWLWLKYQYWYVKLDVFVVMPDHFHGIITID